MKRSASILDYFGRNKKPNESSDVLVEESHCHRTINGSAETEAKTEKSTESSDTPIVDDSHSTINTDHDTASPAAKTKMPTESMDESVIEESDTSSSVDCGTDSSTGPVSSGCVKPSQSKTFKKSWLKKWPWLKLNERGLMLCTLCIKHNKFNTLTAGCSNYRTSTLERHIASSDHKFALQSESLCKDFNVVSLFYFVILKFKTLFVVDSKSFEIENHVTMCKFYLQCHNRHNFF